jgi:AmiR/NasT family two-component response regulator
VQVQHMQAELAAVERELDGLRTAMRTRGVIEQAKGMLMMHRGCDAEEAFAVLVELSQTSHRKLVEVAQALVHEWSERGHAKP